MHQTPETFCSITPSLPPSPPANPKIRKQLTDILLLQKRQRLQIRPILLIIKHITIAHLINRRLAKKLDPRAHSSRQEEHKQDEGEQHHDAWEQFALRDEYHFDDDEDEGEGADGYAVR
jgi:hypothetical protein